MTIIRQAVSTDAHRIATVHVNSWRTTYQGIVPDGVLASLSIEQREIFWREVIEQRQATHAVFVAEDEGTVVGFASAGKERENNPVYTGELYALYLLQQAQRRGSGRALIRGVTGWLLEQGHTTMRVWVLEQNPACAFYEAVGGQFVERKLIQIGDIQLSEIAYGWQDIHALALPYASS